MTSVSGFLEQPLPASLRRGYIIETGHAQLRTCPSLEPESHSVAQMTIERPHAQLLGIPAHPLWLGRVFQFASLAEQEDKITNIVSYQQHKDSGSPGIGKTLGRHLILS